MIRAMLAAYRRTLEKTMAQARSMQQVVDEAGLAWLETPGPGRGLGHGARPPEPTSRTSSSAASRTSSRTGPSALGRLVPGVVPRRAAAPASRTRRARRGAAAASSRVRAIPDIGGMMARARHDRELAGVVGQLGRRRLLGRRLRRWRGRRRRRVLGRRGQLDRGRLGLVGLGAEHVATGLEALDGDRWAAAAHATSPRSCGSAGTVRATPSGASVADPVGLVAERARHRVRRPVVEERLGLGDPGAEPVEGEAEHGRPASPCRSPGRWNGRPSHEPVSTVRKAANFLPSTDCDPMGSPSSSTSRWRLPVVGRPAGATAPVVLRGSRARTPGSGTSTTRLRTASRRGGGCRPGRRRPGRAARRRSAGAGRGARCGSAARRAATRRSRGDPGGVHGRPTVHSGHGCCRDDGRVLREAERRRSRGRGRADGRDDRDARARRRQRPDAARRGARRRLVPARRRGPAHDPGRDPRHRATPTRRTSWSSGRAPRPSTSTPRSASRPGRSPRSTSRPR